MRDELSKLFVKYFVTMLLLVKSVGQLNLRVRNGSRMLFFRGKSYFASLAVYLFMKGAKDGNEKG